MWPMRRMDLVSRARREYDGWLIVGVVFLSAALTTGYSGYAFGLFIEPLRSSFEWQRTAITASLSFMAVSSASSPLIGRAMDRYGARPVMVVSLVVFGTSFLLRPLMTQLWHWYVLSFLQFVCLSGASFLPASRLVGIWFGSARGRAMGIAMMGNNFGGLTVPLIAGLALALASWETAYVVIGASAFLLALLALLVVHERPAYEWAWADRTKRRGPTEAALTGSTVNEALRTRSFYATAVAIALASLTYSAVVPQMGDHLGNEGMPTAVLPLAVSLMAAFGMAGKLVFGYLADRHTARRTMMLSLSGQVVFILLLAAYPSPPLVWVWVALFGLFMGGLGTLTPLLVQEIFGLRHFGSLWGLIAMGSVISFATGPLLAGASFDLTGGYGRAFIIVAGLFFVAIGSLTGARKPPPVAQAERSGPSA